MRRRSNFISPHLSPLSGPAAVIRYRPIRHYRPIGSSASSSTGYAKVLFSRTVAFAVWNLLITFGAAVDATVFDRTMRSRNIHQTFPAVQCYSCMSEAYEPYLTDLGQMYRKQDLVTNRCNEPFFSRGIPYVNCSNICVTMKETFQIAGVRVVTAYIRGCLDKILANHRFNETALLTYNFYRKDHCRELPRSMLIGPSFTGNVWFCACYGNRCNNAPPSTGQYFLNYLFDFITFRTNNLKIDDRIAYWLVLVASCLIHYFGVLKSIRWISAT